MAEDKKASGLRDWASEWVDDVKGVFSSETPEHKAMRERAKGIEDSLADGTYSIRTWRDEDDQ